MNRTSRLLSLTLFAVVAPEFSTSQDLVVFDDTGKNGFSFCVSNPQNYLVESNIVHSGSAAVRMSNTGGPVYLCNDSYLPFSDYDGISFWFNGGIDGGESIVLEVTANPGAKWRAPTWHHFMADHCQRINGCKSKASFPECLFTETWTPSRHQNSIV